MSIQKMQIRNELFSEMKELGFQDEVKKQLRIRLCEKLRERELIKGGQSHDDRLYNRVMVSMVSEELKMSDCGYANSIYVAQAGFDMKTLQRSEIIEIMGINADDLDCKLSVLANFMRKKYPFSGQTIRSVSIQTNPEQIGYTLQQRLTLIDQQYRRTFANTAKSKQQTDYRLKVQQLQMNLKRMYESDIQRFKEFEAHSIKVKVSQEWRKKFEDYARRIQDQYRRKMENLRKKERLLSDDIVNKNKVFDEKVNSTQKVLIQKMDLLDIKSNTVGQTKKNLQTQRRMIKQQHDRQEKQLKDKTRQYDILLLKLREKIDYEVGVAKLAIQQQYQEKSAEFLARKKFVDEEYGKLMGVKEATDTIKQENQRLFEENIQFRKDLTEVQQQLRISMSEGASKSERLDSLRGELNKLQRERNIKQDSLRQQTRKYMMKEEEILQMRKQLDELRTLMELNEKDKEGSNSRGALSDFPKSDLALKIDNLKQQRLKEIEKLKMEL